MALVNRSENILSIFHILAGNIPTTYRRSLPPILWGKAPDELRYHWNIFRTFVAITFLDHNYWDVVRKQYSGDIRSWGGYAEHPKALISFEHSNSVSDAELKDGRKMWFLPTFSTFLLRDVNYCLGA
jgi:hypothetical protein